MKKFLLSSIVVLLLVLISTSDIFAQWTAQTSPTTETLRNVKAVDDNVVWACGYNGVVLRTIDGGTTWELKTLTDAGYYNYVVDAISANIAWVTGTLGGNLDAKIWKTTDGGTTWVEQWHDATTFSNGLRMFDANNGVAYFDPAPANEWIILTTSDGGSTWNKVLQTNIPAADGTNGEVGLATTMTVLGDNVWFSSYTNIDSKVYRSTDKGLTWAVSGPLLSGMSSGSIYMAFRDANYGVTVGGDGLPGLTTDGGATWNYSTTSNGLVMRSIANVSGTDIFLAIADAGKSTVSYDGGLTWTEVTATASAKRIRNITSTNSNAWCVGETGTIHKWSGPALPVELTSFTASVINQQVKLNWLTASELNNNGFEVQRKAEGHDFVNVGFVKGNGTSTSKREYSFVDKSIASGKYSYRLKQIDFSGAYNYSNTVEVEVKILDSYSLEQNYPNPFNPTTKIGYVLKDKSNAKVAIMNAIGQEVAVLINEEQEAGYHQLDFNASNLPSGIYFYKLEAGNFTKTMKMILLK